MRWLTRDRNFYRMLAALAIPVALQNLITFAVTLADNLMVGALGDAAVSGVYMGGQIQTLLQMFSGGIEGAILVLAAQYWGRRDVARIRCISAIGLRASLAFGLLLTAVCFAFPGAVLSLFTDKPRVIAEGAAYLRIVCLSYVFFCATQALIAATRSVDRARIGMWVSSVSLLVNVGLNYVLIFGKLGAPAMGVRGAALATLISRMAEAAVMLAYILAVDDRLKLRLKHFLESDGELRRDFIRCGAPIIGGQIVWSVNMMTNSAILGRFTEEVMTAASVANTMNSLAYVCMNGMSSAVSVITGKTVGEGRVAQMKEYARTVQLLFLGLGLLTGGMIALLRAPFISLYAGITPQARLYSMQFILVLSVTMIGTCYQAACLAGLVKAGGDVDFVFKNDAIFVFLVVLPSAFIAARLGAAPWVVFALLKSDQILKCFVAVVKINRFDWIRNLTRGDAAAQ